MSAKGISLGINKFVFINMFVLFLLLPLKLRAEDPFTWNLAYQNPYTSTVGMNILKFMGEWGFEAGLGYYNAPEREVDDTGEIHLGAAFSAKKFFMHDLIRPYAQAGLGLSSGSKGKGAGNGASGFFGGAGILVYSQDFYTYLSYNYSQNGDNPFLQLGIGFPIK